MKSIFILGASRLQVPAIKKAKERGLYVYVLDYDENAVGIKDADEFLNISTTDSEAVYEAALKYKPDYIITSTSDMPVRTVAWVNEKLGRKNDISYQGALWATDKGLMRDRMKECNVPIPEFRKVTTLEEFHAALEDMPERFVIKPADNAASRGVVLADRQTGELDELFSYAKKYSRSGVVLLEEYMDGPEVSVESYTVDGEPHIITITDKLVTEEPYFVELGHTEPSRLAPEVQEEIRKVAIAAIRALGMQDGPNHTEIKVTKDGPKLVEIAARLGGDFITSKLVPLSTGVDMVECSYETLLGEDVHFEPTVERGAAIRFIGIEEDRYTSDAIEGVFDGVRGLDEAVMMDGIVEIEIYAKQNDKICHLKNSSDRIGHIIAVGRDADEAAECAENALRKIEVIIK